MVFCQTLRLSLMIVSEMGGKSATFKDHIQTRTAFLASLASPAK